MRRRYWAGIAAAILLGLILLVAGLGKLPQQTRAYWIMFNLPHAILAPKLADQIDIWLPRLELAIGSLLIIGIATRLATVITLVLIIGFIFNNIWMIAEGFASNPCHCFGPNSFLGYISITQALYIDIGMLALAAIILFWYPGNRDTLRPWFLKKELKCPE